jgi:TRAP transporter TAXI family solute receptor
MNFPRLTTILAGVALTLAAGAYSPKALALETFPTLLCPHGCGPNAGDTILMNQMIKAGTPAVLNPQESPGYLANIRMMKDESRWESYVFGTEDTVIQLAVRGGQPWFDEFLPEPVDIKFKLLYGEAWWAQGRFFVTYDPELKTVSDLKGKKIAVGLRSQSDWGFNARLVLKYGYGITPENTEIDNVNPGTLTQQLIDGNVDATVSVFAAEPHQKNWLIGGPLRQLEAAGDLHYISIEPEVIDKINEQFDTTFLSLKVPAGSLPDQDEDINVAVNRGFKAVHPSFSEESAYKIVKSVLEMGPKMKELHPLWEIWSPELMVHGLSEENAHPGAIRAYKEAGLWEKAVSDYAEFQITYPSQ